MKEPGGGSRYFQGKIKEGSLEGAPSEMGLEGQRRSHQ